MNESEIKIFCDGGARGNPGPAAYGFVIYDNSNKILFEEGRTIGDATNNVAEYSGIVAALKWISEQTSIINHQPLTIKVFLDSQLATEQLSGRWKIKNENLRNLFFTIKQLEQQTGANISYSHVPREKNKEADRLVNRALDA
jgi:ribonuclease HI